jgi:hypothetical protein
MDLSRFKLIPLTYHLLSFPCHHCCRPYDIQDEATQVIDVRTWAIL